jgi:hypothetical protein
MPTRLTGVCQHCAHIKLVDQAGRVTTHMLTSSGGRRRCPGSGRPPRPAQ